MNNFWHFGDSFSFNDFNLESEWKQEDNFGHIISKKLGLDYKFRSLTGISNYQIFNLILQEYSNFIEGDVIFINWSFFSRGQYIDLNELNLNSETIQIGEIIENNIVKSTNHWFDENHSQFNEDAFEFYDFITNHQFLMDYNLKYNLDFNVKLFYNIITFFQNLIQKNIKIYNLFIRDNEYLFYNTKKYKLNFENLLGETLKFEPSYFEWLEKNEYKGEEEGHYTKGMQTILAEEIHQRMMIDDTKYI